MWKWIICTMLLWPVVAMGQRADGQRLATPAEKALVLDAARQVIKDPDSAKIPTLVVMPNPRGAGLIFCGFLNAKNSYGGYTGNQMFAGRIIIGSDRSPVSAQVLGMDDANTYAGSLACKSLGFP